jgi:hypothetical protein
MNTELRTGNNPAFILFNMSQEQIDEISRRHDKIEEQAWAYVNSYIKPVDEKILKRFAYKYATDTYTDEQFLDSMLVNAKETNNPRLIEAITFVVENFCLNGCVNLGMIFAKRPDAFSGDFIEAAVKADEGSLRNNFLNYARR